MSVDVIDLELTVVKADGLAAKDTNIFGMKTKSDPYVEVRLCPRGPSDTENTKILVGKTVPKMKTLAPRWDQSFTISLPKHEFTDIAMFELTIMDYDRGNDDDLMGVVQVPIARPGTTTKWYGVPATSANGEEATGRIQCTLANFSGVKTIQELREAAESRSQAANAKVDKPVKEGSGGAFVELKLVVKKAEDLVAMDSNIIGMKTKSDPYIEVRLCPQGGSCGEDKKIFLGKTATQMRTLSPKFNETFTTTQPIKNLADNAIFELTIMDYDETNEDDLMGVVPIPIKINQLSNNISSKWFDVPKCSGEGGYATGRVQCSLTKTAVKEMANTEAETAQRLKAAMASRRTGGPGPAAGAGGAGAAMPKPAVIARATSAPAAVATTDESESADDNEEEEQEQAQAQRRQPASPLPTRVSSRRLDGGNNRGSRNSRSPRGSGGGGKPIRGSSSREGGGGGRLKRTGTSDGSSGGKMRRSATTDGNQRSKRTPEGVAVRRSSTTGTASGASSSRSSAGGGGGGRHRISSSGRVRSSRNLEADDDGAIKKNSSRGSKGPPSTRRVSRSPTAGDRGDGGGMKRSSSSRMSGGARTGRSSRQLQGGGGGEEDRAKRSSSGSKKSLSRANSFDGASGDEGGRGMPKRAPSSRGRGGMDGRQRSSRNMEGGGGGRPSSSSKSRPSSRKPRTPPVACQ